jgi:signal transduction histidine kinase/CheY-like chemotaxis protein
MMPDYPHRLFRIGTAGVSDEADRSRIILVNTLCIVTGCSIIGVGATVCAYLNWRPLLVIPFGLEFVINASVLFFNMRRKYVTAAIILFFLQSVMIIYLSAVLGKLLRLDVVVVLLFAINFLLFKTKKLRMLGIAAALLDLIIIEALYYKNPFELPIVLSSNTVFVIQMSVIAIMTLITILISGLYVKSNNANEELKRANHLIKIYVAQITHELRTPLDNIHHVTQLLRGEVHRDPNLNKIKPLADIGWTVSSNARNIVNNVLQLAEIEAGKSITIINEAFKVRPFFEKIMEVFMIMARREEMKIHLEIDDNMPEVIFGDPLAITQIVTNLLSNAIKYGERRTTIKMIVSNSTPHWQIQIVNYGTGITADRADSVFDPFVTNSKGHIQGSGLGLYIVRSKVEAMGGTVYYENEQVSLNKFTVILSLKEGKLRDLPDPAGTDAEAGDLQKVYVLVAEDDKLTAYLLSRSLKEMGCSYTMTKNGQELIDVAQKKCPDECPDIIILDCHMPILDGVETIRRLKQTPELMHIPIIITTGDLYSDTVDRMLAAGANSFLKKPIDHQALRKAILLYHQRLPQN